ncbi:hypothetical protein Acr_01g0010620 [Actinidia rufa]|uniref:Uncharacterized protein n=1 Tax=Actinidia rufa TaxID=165716 RepID=A0A7J0E422_9ERIC|nr:hypothetical protein Acr_01g0010620 [Actinidia rufa]
MMPFDFNFEVPQSNQDWDSHHVSTYSPPPPWSEELLYTESHPDMTSIGQLSYGQQNFADIYSPQVQYPLVPDVYQYSQNRVWRTLCSLSFNTNKYRVPSPSMRKLCIMSHVLYVFSHSHFVTECPQAREFSEFVQKYVNTTHGCLNPSSDNSYSYTQDNEWETHSNSSWTQEPWVDDSNTFCPPSQFIATSEQPCQHYYPLLPPKNSDFEDSMLQTLQEYEASIQTFASTCQSIAELEIQVDKLVQPFSGHEEQESLTQAQQEQICEVETISERHNGELWETESELNSFEVEHNSEDHENLTHKN